MSKGAWIPKFANLLLFNFILAGTVYAETEAPMMVKSQSGVELAAGVDWGLCTLDGVAIGGYDPVSYRQEGGPRIGIAGLFVEHKGKLYRFVNQANRTEFLKNPDRYAPAYSGFCAVTLALGRVTCPDYTNFKIEDDRLLLFEVTGFTNGRTLWNSDADQFRQRADGNFERLLELQ